VDSKDIQLDLDFEGTMKLYAKEVEAAQAAKNSATTSTTSVEGIRLPLPERRETGQIRNF
jgi:hypothetical protein